MSFDQTPKTEVRLLDVLAFDKIQYSVINYTKKMHRWTIIDEYSDSTNHNKLKHMFVNDPYYFINKFAFRWKAPYYCLLVPRQQDYLKVTKYSNKSSNVGTTHQHGEHQTSNKAEFVCYYSKKYKD